MSIPRTLEEILQSTSDVLFPAGVGEERVGVGSVGIGGDTPLHVMAWRNDIEGARLLVGAGANVNAIGDMGETALHVAVRQRNTQLVVLLLQAGANPDVRSEFAKTAREEAAAIGGAIAILF